MRTPRNSFDSGVIAAASCKHALYYEQASTDSVMTPEYLATDLWAFCLGQAVGALLMRKGGDVEAGDVR